MKKKILYIQIVNAAFRNENLEQLPLISVVDTDTGGYILEGLEPLKLAILKMALSEQGDYSEFVPFAISCWKTRSQARSTRRIRRRRR